MVKKVLRKTAIAAIWLCIWFGAALLVGADYLLPAPAEVLRTLVSLAVTGEFWLSVFNSMLRIFAGFALGVIIGCSFAVVSSLNSFVKEFLAPLSSVIKATPVASFILLALVWLNKSTVPLVTAILIVLPVVWKNVTTGIDEADSDILEMAECFGMKKSKKLTAIYIPSVKPYFASACTTALGMAWKAGIAAEVICAPHNTIGYSLYQSKIYFKTPELFAWTLTIIALSFLAEKLFVFIFGRAMKRR